MLPRTPRSTRTDALVPFATRFRYQGAAKLFGSRFGALGGLGNCFFQQQAGVEYVGAEGGGALAIHFGVTGYVVLSYFLRSEEHTSELQSLMRISYAVFCLKKKLKNLSSSYSQTSNLSLKHTH